ncbi:MAG: penicillin-binding protein [Actinomycetota bacterium]|jgi:peptidoglycan glycosyltransferase|nr:penicillin-binding protein [Actinomycetota bacterium]
MERQIRRVGIGIVLAFLAVFFQLNYVQIFAAESISQNPANRLQLIREYSIKRGEILTLDGQTMARSKAQKGLYKYRRLYPGGALYGHITGWYSVRYGLDRLERTYRDQLLGEGGTLSMQDIQDRFLGSGEQGDDIRTTIASRLQEAARQALGDNRGAIVAMDPQTGEIRALWSNPSFDPTPLSSFDSRESKQYWESLDPSSSTSALVNIATTRGYPPGSTFKVVTAAAALQSGQYKPDSTFPDPEKLEPCEGAREPGDPCLPLTTESLTNFTHQPCLGGGQINLFDALRISCDTTFALIGMDIPSDVRSMAESLGFNQPLPFDLRTEPSQFPDIDDANAPLRAYAGIGQGDVNATPLQMAVVAATVANGGQVPQPRLVREIIDQSGRVVRRFEPQVMSQAMSPDVARVLTEMMVAAVDNGTGGAAQIPGVKVAGKTGTAQTVKGQNPHTWFICFAPADNPQLAVAVIVENGGTFGSEATGGAVAAPLARQILEIDRELRGW